MAVSEVADRAGDFSRRSPERTWWDGRGSWPGGSSAPLLFEQSLEFGDHFQILGTAGGPLKDDQSLKGDNPGRLTERRDALREREQLLVESSAGNLAEDVYMPMMMNWTLCSFIR